MEVSSVGRQRRPFLTPIWITVLLGLIVAGVAVAIYRSARTTTFIVVPAAESIFGSIHDAPLSPAGEERADQLARLFGDATTPARIAAIYETSTRRSEQTAAPLAARLGLQPIVLDEPERVIVRRALHAHRGETVMIVSGDPSAVVEALTGNPIVAPRREDPGSIYIVSDPLFGRSGIVELHY